MLANVVQPRWGVGSVRLHLDLNDLTLAVLLFDRIVIPTPDNDAEVERWMRKGWKPDELATRIVQLGELVDLLPWDEALRNDWEARWEQLKAIGREAEALAYGYTPLVIAQRAWNDVFLHAQQEGRAPQRPVPVLWCPAAADAMSELGLNVVRQAASRMPQVEQQVGVLFRRELAYPMSADPEESLEIALRLATTDDFVAARRALFEWELIVAGQDQPLEEALEGLRQAADRYDELVESSVGTAVRRAVHFLVPSGASQAAKLTGLPGAGVVGGWTARKVLARFAPLPSPPSPEIEEGAALSMARRAMTAVFPG